MLNIGINCTVLGIQLPIAVFNLNHYTILTTDTVQDIDIRTNIVVASRTKCSVNVNAIKCFRD